MTMRLLRRWYSQIFAVDGLLSKRRDLSASLERSGSFQRNHLEEQDMRLRKIDGYELSADIRDKQLEVLRVSAVEI